MSEVRKTIETYKKAHRLANYISAAMLYLKSNQLLERELKSDDIKDRILGHWGTVPGLNFIYQGLSFAAKKYNKEILLVTGPGHGAPAILANTYLEGTLSEYYKKYSKDKKGLSALIHDFSWPGGFPSHTTPMVPGTIHEGGELGYSLATAFGAAFDNPDLTVACVVGDGEAETGTLSASWHGNKFLNPQKDGTVLPILHLNGYRISGPTIFSSMSEGEIMCYFKGLGYDPLFVDQYSSIDIYIDFLEAMIMAFEKINRIKSEWQNYDISKPTWPVIVLKTMKGWTGPVELDGKKIEDSNLSHGIPLQHPKQDDEEFKLLKNWLESYKVEELLDKNGKPIEDIKNFYPEGDLRISSNKLAFGGNIRKDIKYPQLENHALRIFKRGERPQSRMEDLSKYLREIFRGNRSNFRIFSPDESESNLLEELFDTTDRVYLWPLKNNDEYFSKEGMVVEILSENVLMSMLQGYNLTGGHGVLISYEAFLNVISSQIDQHIKYLKQSLEVDFRKPVPSLNLISTSTLWRQEHNGYTHQNPTLINSLLLKNPDLVRIYLPSDVNSLLVAMEESLRSTDRINLIVACKRDLPQWVSLDEAREEAKTGLNVWSWASNFSNDEKISLINTDLDESNQINEPDVVLVSAGDYQTNETMEGIKLLNELIPELKVKYINVWELNQFRSFVNGDIKEVENMFTNDRDIVFNFHGYPDAIKQLTWNTPIAPRLKIMGYLEEGTTTTPFDMEVVNKASRYHVCIEAIKSASKFNDFVKEKEQDLVNHFEQKLEQHKKYIVENGKDMEL